LATSVLVGQCRLNIELRAPACAGSLRTGPRHMQLFSDPRPLPV